MERWAQEEVDEYFPHSSLVLICSATSGTQKIAYPVYRGHGGGVYGYSPSRIVLCFRAWVLMLVASRFREPRATPPVRRKWTATTSEDYCGGRVGHGVIM